MRFLLFILLAAFLTNCTIQKRVHRKGWHVEWRKSHKSDGASVQNKERTSDEVAEKNDKPVTTAQQKTIESRSSFEPREEVSASERKIAEDRKEVFSPNTIDIEADGVETSLQGEKNTPVQSVDNESKKEAHQSQTRNFGNPGTAVLITGAVLLLLGILALLILVFATDLGGAILGAVLFAVLGGIGLILMLVGLIIIVAN